MIGNYIAPGCQGLAALVALAWLLTSGSPARADFVTVLSAPGTTNVTSGLGASSTTGAMMDGMQVTAFFSNGSSQTATWADVPGAPGNDGAAVGTGWLLYLQGDTFTSDWRLFNTTGLSMTRLLIDAGPGNAVFDRTFGGNAGSPGSGSGNTFDVTSPNQNLNITATYRDLVAIGANPPVGDLYRRLDISFNNGLGSGHGISFEADTDSLRFAGDLHAAPAPPAVVLAGCGALVLVAYRRFRRPGKQPA